MNASRRNKRSDQAHATAPGADDVVLATLREAEARYVEIYASLTRQSIEAQHALAKVRDDNETLTQKIATLQHELDRERRRVQHERHTADTLATVLKDIHRSVFGGSVYDLILKACLTLTGATRGLYVTTNEQGQQPRVRAAIEMHSNSGSPPSDVIKRLCREAVANERVVRCNDMSVMPEQPADGESVGDCLVAPVVLRNSLSGAVVVADKAGGDFDEHDADVLLSIGSHAAVAIENTHLQREIQEAYLAIITVLAETMAARNQQNGRYHELGCRLARDVAARLGLSEYDQSIVYHAALLHDIGNIGVSDGVLNKPGPLLDAERELIRAHTQIGHDLLREIPVLEAVAGIVRHHHERYDGTGYPEGLQGDAIPIAARIVTVVDAYGSMLAPRSYRPARNHDEACQELRRAAGTQFDPRVVDAFLAALGSADLRTIEHTDGPLEVSLPGLDLRHVRTPV
jgi:HD-GYP domain-containing protein (c-di-GMP phosphodiesterase class II)